MKIGAVELKFSALKESSLSEWLLRFVFGGFVSVVAALVGKKFGPEIGGLFLAFPSILPATLTLIVHHRTRKDASDDGFGAALGSLAFCMFGITILVTASSIGFIPSLWLATLVWILSATAIWLFASW